MIWFLYMRLLHINLKCRTFFPQLNFSFSYLRRIIAFYTFKRKLKCLKNIYHTTNANATQMKRRKLFFRKQPTGNMLNMCSHVTLLLAKPNVFCTKDVQIIFPGKLKMYSAKKILIF